MKRKGLIILLISTITIAGVANAYTIHEGSVIEIPLENYDLKVRAGEPVDYVRNQTRLQ